MKKIKMDPKSYAKEMGVKLPRKRKKKDTVLDIESREDEEWDEDDDYTG